MANFQSINIYSGSFITGSDRRLLTSSIVGAWEVDPDDGQSIQFRIPKEKIGTSNDRIGFYISASGEVGIGTKDPESAFDIRDNTEDTRPDQRTAKSFLPLTSSLISSSGKVFGSQFIASNAYRLNDSSGTDRFIIKETNNAVEVGNENFTGVSIIGHISSSGNVTSSGNIMATGNFMGNNIGSIQVGPSPSGSFNFIYLTPVDFITDSSARAEGLIDNDGARITDGGGRLTYYAQKIIPKGYKATHVKVIGAGASDRFEVHSSSFDVRTAAEVGAITDMNIEKDITDVIGGDGTYVSVAWSSRGSTSIYGGYIKLEIV